MASDTLTRWGTALVTTALAAAVVVGCAPAREEPTDPVAPEQTSEDREPATETGDGTVPGAVTGSGQDAAESDGDSVGSDATPNGMKTDTDTSTDDSRGATSTGTGY